MENCPRCDETRSWRLADGRHKCVRCGMRYSWTGVWDAVRLPEPAKEALLDSFVQGLPSYRQRFVSPVNAKSRERFYRLCRAVCAATEQVRRPSAAVIVGDRLHDDEPERLLVLQLVRLGACVRPVPIAPDRGLTAPRRPGLHSINGNGAQLTLPLRGDYVSLQGVREAAAEQTFADFWRYAQGWLQPYHALPRNYFHLYLSEICFRFNRRDAALAPLLRQLLQQSSIQSLRPLLRREAAVARPPSVATAARRVAREPVRHLARHQA